MFDFKPFSRKQLDVICNADAFINFLEGSVRSGKTIASIVAWINFVRESPHRKFLMTGGTSDTLYRNVIEDIIAIMGEDYAAYSKSTQGGARLTLKFGKVKKICYCVGAHDARAESRIRGLTVAGWYADEVTLYPESVVKQCINRMSLSGARAIWTANPDSPSHYIKVEFLDKAQEKGYKTWHFDLDDNLALDEDYKKNIKNAYAGMWYKRMILGLWVQAEGAIYDMFDADLNTFTDDDLVPGFRHLAKRYISCDIGTQNATVFLDGYDDGETIWIAGEYYHSGKKSNQQKEHTQYVEDLVKFVGDEHPPLAVIVDPSAANFKVAMRNKGLRPKDADNDVGPGLERTATMISKRRLRIHKHRCPETIKEIYGYVWNDKAVDRGVEEPLKKDDHCMDAMRYLIMALVSKRRAMT